MTRSDNKRGAARVGIVVATLGLTSLAAWAGLSSSAEKKTAEPASKPKPVRVERSARVVAALPPEADAEGRAPGCTFEPGRTLSYRIEQTTMSHVDPQALGLPAQASAQAQHTLVRTLQTSFDLEVLEVEADGSAVLLGRYQGLTSEEVAEPHRLEAPFLVRIAPSCRITGFARHEHTLLPHARTQQAILHELAWRWPSTQSGLGAREEGQDEDGLGAFVATFATHDHDGGLLVQRGIQRYTKYWEDERGKPSRLDAVPESSTMHVRVGAGPWFSALSARTVLRGDGIDSDNRVFVRTQESTGESLADASHKRDDYRFENLLPRHYTLRAPRVVSRLDHEARDLVRHLSAEESVQQYLARVKNGAGYVDQWTPLMHYLEARPEQTKAIVDSMKRGDIPDSAAPGVYVALGRTRTEEAKQALWEIVEDEAAPTPERMRAMFNMIDRDDVDVTFAQTLAAYTARITSGDSAADRVLGRESLLALGAMAGLRQDPEVSTIARGAVESVIGSSREAMVARPALGAIANMGDPSLLSLAEPLAKSRDEAMRVAAAVVVRRMHPNDVTDFVARRLAGENSPNVKRELYRTLENQLADTPVAYGRAVILEAVKDLAEQPGPMTRHAIISVLGAAASEHPEARAALIAQIPIELERRSGLYSVIASYLTATDLQEALAYAQ